MDCPRCHHTQVFPDARECERCGVIFARLPVHAVHDAPEVPPAETPAPDAADAPPIEAAYGSL